MGILYILGYCTFKAMPMICWPLSVRHVESEGYEELSGFSNVPNEPPQRSLGTLTRPDRPPIAPNGP